MTKCHLTESPSVTTSPGCTNRAILHLDLLIKLRDPESSELIASFSESVTEAANLPEN